MTDPGKLGCTEKQSLDDEGAVFSLGYVSNAVVDFDAFMLERLVRKASLQNSNCDVTGYLCFFDNCFVQYLEGCQASLQTVMDLVQKDDRHQIVNIINFPVSKNRYFPDWRMRLIGQAALTEIKLEHILLELLKRTNHPRLHDDNFKHLMVRIVDKIAANQARMNLY